VELQNIASDGIIGHILTSIKCCEGENITRLTFVFGAIEKGGISSPPEGTYSYDGDFKYSILEPKKLTKIDFHRFRLVDNDTIHLGSFLLWNEKKMVKKWNSQNALKFKQGTKEAVANIKGKPV
jgi:hypothetical protein